MRVIPSYGRCLILFLFTITSSSWEVLYFSQRQETKKFSLYVLTPQLLWKVLPFLPSQGAASRRAGGKLRLAVWIWSRNRPCLIIVNHGISTFPGYSGYCKVFQQRLNLVTTESLIFPFNKKYIIFQNILEWFQLEKWKWPLNLYRAVPLGTFNAIIY